MNYRYRGVNAVSILVILLAMMFIQGCRPDTVQHVIVREKNFRIGPVDLPLSEEGKDTVLLYLLRGGDNDTRDFVDPDAKKRYGGFFKKLTDPAFLDMSRFRQEKKIGKIDAELSQWFKPTIIYALIDATRDRPLAVNPLCLQDKSGKYWWVFFPSQNPEEDGKLLQLLITRTIADAKTHYTKMKE